MSKLSWTILKIISAMGIIFFLYNKYINWVESRLLHVTKDSDREQLHKVYNITIVMYIFSFFVSRFKLKSIKDKEFIDGQIKK
jgi:hypothetical protein